jgi:DNA polymerase-3 subunit gamma/tau
LIDEVHMLSGHSFNALLKTLEEPPPHVKFLLATTDPQKLPVTVLSRCLKFNLKRLLPEQISGQMRRILDAEQIAFESDALTELARAADGSLRDGLSLLDQAIAYGAGTVRAGEVRAMLGTIERGQVHALISAAHAGDGAKLMTEVDRLAEFSPDFGGVLDEIAGALHRVQLKQLISDYASLEEAESAGIDALAAALSPEETQLFYQFAVVGRRDLPLAPTPRAGFEMTLLRMLAFAPAAAGERVATAPARAAQPSPASANTARVVVPSLPPIKAAPSASDAAATSPPPVPRAATGVAEPQQAMVEKNLALPASAPVSISAAPAAAPIDVGDWAAMIQAAGLRGPVGQLAQHATLISVEQHVVRLALKPAHEHFNAPVLVATMEEKLGMVLGRAVKVRFEKNAGAQLTEAPAEIAGRERSARQQATEQAMNDDPVVQALLRDFDARIVPESIKPNV